MSTPATSSTPNYNFYCGVDIAARTFTAAWCKAAHTPSKAASFDQTTAGFEKFKQWLLAKAATADAAQFLVVMEATGNYWIELATYLHAAGFSVSCVNPRQAHAFAKATGQRAKNDLLDAQLLCRLATTLVPATWQPPERIYYELYQRLTHRQALMEARQQFRNQLHALSVTVAVETVSQSLTTLIATLTESIKQVESEIQTILGQEHEWAKAITLLQTIVGIGWLSACWMVVVTLNFTSCATPEALTNYVGLAPLERSSGTSVRGRPMLGKGGHSRLRAILYMAAHSAIRFNPIIKEYAERLRNAQGKAYKVVCLAVARKLLHLAFAMVKSGKAFDPNYGSRSKAKAKAAEQAA